MRLRQFAVLALVASLTMPTVATAQSACGSLWYERNAIYKAAGCTTTITIAA